MVLSIKETNSNNPTLRQTSPLQCRAVDQLENDASIERGTNLYYQLVDEYFSHYLPCEETAPPALIFQVTPASPSQLQHSLIIITTSPRQLQPGSLCFHIYASFNLDYTVGQNSDKIFIALEISSQ